MKILNNYDRYKIIGQILFWIGSIVFAITAFYVASNHHIKLNLDLVLKAIIPNIGFALAVYLNLYLLIPKFLKLKNYIFYIFWLVLVLAISSLLIQFIFIFLLHTNNFSDQFASLFSSHFFTALFYVGITSLFKFIKDWLQLQEMKLNYSQIEREKLEAELNTLKSQLNPHFLFNCLNNIYSLALTNSPKTPEIVLKLSDLMRHVLYESRENYIPVKKELEFLDNFIELQKIRQNNKIDIQYVVVGIIPDKKVIPLIFEPFIDNAFKHGLKNPAPNPYIKIKVTFNENIMDFELINNFQTLPTNIISKSSGIGLKNIEKRLEYLYKKEDYNLEIKKSEDTFSVKMKVFFT